MKYSEKLKEEGGRGEKRESEFGVGELAQVVERSLGMREVGGLISTFSKFYSFYRGAPIFQPVVRNEKIRHFGHFFGQGQGRAALALLAFGMYRYFQPIICFLLLQNSWSSKGICPIRLFIPVSSCNLATRRHSPEKLRTERGSIRPQLSHQGLKPSAPSNQKISRKTLWKANT